MDVEIVDDLKTEFAELNKLADSLFLVNKELTKTPLAGKQPPRLLDQRDYLLLEMSKYAGLDVELDKGGRALVKLEGTSKSMRFVEENKVYALDPKFSEIAGGRSQFCWIPTVRALTWEKFEVGR